MPVIKDFFKAVGDGCEAALSSFRVEAERCSGGMSISVSGVIGVGEFTKATVFVLTHKGKIRVIGDGLRLFTFENRIVEIRGKISSVEFVYGKS